MVFSLLRVFFAVFPPFFEPLPFSLVCCQISTWILQLQRFATFRPTYLVPQLVRSWVMDHQKLLQSFQNLTVWSWRDLGTKNPRDPIVPKEIPNPPPPPRYVTPSPLNKKNTGRKMQKGFSYFPGKKSRMIEFISLFSGCLLRDKLVGGFNPFEKYARQIGSFPQVGLKIINLWVATT